MTKVIQFPTKKAENGLAELCQKCVAKDISSLCLSWVSSNSSRCKVSKEIEWKMDNIRIDLTDTDEIVVTFVNVQGIEAGIITVGMLENEPIPENAEEFIERHKAYLVDSLESLGFKIKF